MTIVPGAKLGPYEIRSKLGEGGMGEVFLAEDSRLRRRVALKIRRDVSFTPGFSPVTRWIPRDENRFDGLLFGFSS